MKISQLLTDANHIRVESRMKPGFPDEFKFIRPKLSTELKKWMEDNKIQYELRGVTNWILPPKKEVSDVMYKLYTQLGIEFTNPSEAVLFKLRWL